MTVYRKSTEVIEVLEFWNNTHKLTMLFELLEEPIEPPPEEIKIPTNILLSLVKVLPNIPTEIKLIQI